MAFSGARGNLSQVRQLVGMRGLMSDPSGEILQLPIKKNFREGLTITDYLMSGYGARKGIIDTALKTANSGYLTRRLIDVAQDIIIREKDCLTPHSCIIENKPQIKNSVYDKILGRLVNKPIYDSQTNELIAEINTQITPELIRTLKQKNIKSFYIRSPLTCSLYRSICQKCYGWDLATENLIDVGEAIGIIAGQSIGEPGTQLTMRTFHTGGIFTSEIKGKIRSPISGILKFSKRLKRLPVRTTRGEDVLLTKNAGSLLLIPEQKNQEPVKLELFRNTIIFYKNNQYVQKNAILAELVDDEKQTRTEIKPVLSTSSGEVFIPHLKTKRNLINQTKLLWILSGQVYKAPMSSFLNLSNDYKINKNSYVFRTKLVNDFPGFTGRVNKETNLFRRILQLLLKTSWTLEDTTIKKLSESIENQNYILNTKTLKYFVNLMEVDSKIIISPLKNQNFGSLITNDYLTKTGGSGYYDYRINLESCFKGSTVSYFLPIEPIKRNQFLYTTLAQTKRFVHRSIIWLPEETYKLDCENSILLVENGNFISENFEIIPGLFSKTEGSIKILQNNKTTQEISIQCGSVYKGKHFNKLKNKVFYPGEVLLDSIKILQPSLCEYIGTKGNEQLIIRPLTIYEIPYVNSEKQKNTSLSTLPFNLKDNLYYCYNSTQFIKHFDSINLATNTLQISMPDAVKNQSKIELRSNPEQNTTELLIDRKANLNQYIVPYLRYKNIQSSLLVQSKQFIDIYTILGYLEAVIPSAKEIVQFKSKSQDYKEICLISNDDCMTVPKEFIKNKTIDSLLINDINVNYTGKILMDNGNMVTIQKGRPYFFPNCKNEDFMLKTDLQYKPVFVNNVESDLPTTTQRKISLNYYDITKGLAKQRTRCQDRVLKFNKMFIKKNGKLFSSVLIRPLHIFSISDKLSKTTNVPTYQPSMGARKFLKNWNRKRKKGFPKWFGMKGYRQKDVENYKKPPELRSLFFTKSSDLRKNPLKQITNEPSALKLGMVLNSHKYTASATGGIHAITDDYFDQEVNSVFCKNGEFIEDGQTIGLLNFEKEITGDIVQGLPRVEQLLEARKKRQASKNLPLNQKKNLLTQTTSLDSYFEFRKLGTTIKENEKINPHNLLKVYFNYYGLKKSLLCEKELVLNSYRLLSNYEASYRSFKKVQSLILNSVQSVYKSQGVGISDKHIEVIIKQMTTKVLITYQGNTALLPHEVVDLYHIKYINEIAQARKKQTALYVPLLLGITKAALNNPSFISAASFQETTRVLTKAAIEGRIDWLRGLKENIVTGHLMPAGTGSPVYTNYFKKPVSTSLNTELTLEQTKNNIKN